MRGKLSSTDRRDMLATIYGRTHSVARSSRSASWKEDANCGTKQREVKMPNSSSDQNNHPAFPIQPMRGSLKDTSGAEDTPTKQASPSVSRKPSPHLKKVNDGRERVRFSLSRKEDGQNSHQHCHSSRSFSRGSKNTDAVEDELGKQVGPSMGRKSSPHLKKVNDGREGVRFSLSPKEDGRNFHQHCHSSRSFSRGSKNKDAVEDKHRKQVGPSMGRKSSPHAVTPRESNNSGFFSSSKSEKQNDGYERVDVSLNHKEVPRSVSGGSKRKYVIEDKHGKQISSPLLKSREDDSCGRVGWTEAPRKKLICNDGPVDVILPTKEVRASSSAIEHPANSSISSVPVKPIPTSNSDACLNKMKSQKRKSPQARCDSLKYPRNGPASEIIWKGAFEVLNLSHEMGFCKGFTAHPPAQVSAKAYKFSKQLTGVLKFKLASRIELWPEIFKIRSPDWNDIALYFYPGRDERSIKKYSDLLQYMEKKDFVLRSVIGSVELLGFASKTLALDCQHMKGSYFMWGVFRRLKGKTRT